jgi:hypothetical protein
MRSLDFLTITLRTTTSHVTHLRSIKAAAAAEGGKSNEQV